MQRLLLTEQESGFNKLAALMDISADAIGSPINADFIQELQEYVATDPEILKLYMASHFSDVIKYTARIGLPSSSAATLKKEYFGRLASLQTVEEIASLSAKLLKDIDFQLSNYDTSGLSQNIREAIQYIHTMRFQPLTTTDVANHLHMNRSYLSHHFHEEVGMCMIEYIHRMKLNFADQLRISGEYSFAEIADILGYSSYRYFAQVYKKYRGVLPNQIS